MKQNTEERIKYLTEMLSNALENTNLTKHTSKPENFSILDLDPLYRHRVFSFTIKKYWFKEVTLVTTYENQRFSVQRIEKSFFGKTKVNQLSNLTWLEHLIILEEWSK